MSRFIHIFGICAAVLACAFASAKEPMTLEELMTPIKATVTIDATKTLRTFDPRRLGGTNIAAWNAQSAFTSPDVQRYMSSMKPAFIRIPGGSWSDYLYWNGNGVRDDTGKVDPTKVGADGYPAIDYSAYKPSFTVDPKTLHPNNSGWHGHIDIKGMHEFVKSIDGAQAFVCVNAGTGRAIDAAEWVKFANKTNNYNVKYWEIGNELDGSWEAGHFLPFDKGTLTGEMYAARYKQFATAMKAVDPTIKIGGAATGTGDNSFTKAMLQYAGDQVDFVTIHTYPGTGAQTEHEKLDAGKNAIAKEVGQVKKWIAEYQPNRINEIEIGYSEWNQHVEADPNTNDLFSGLWTAMMLAEMAKNGVDFATQWDCFTHKPEGSHAMFFDDSGKWVPKAGYYAIEAWNRLKGKNLLKADSSNGKIYVVATLDDEDVLEMILINLDPDHAASISLNLQGFIAGKAASTLLFRQREYFWNPITKRPDWSRPHDAFTQQFNEKFPMWISPSTLTLIRIPSNSSGVKLPETIGKPSLSIMHLDMVLPDTVYAGDPVRGFVRELDESNIPIVSGDSTNAVALTANALARFDRTHVWLPEAVGQFEFVAEKPGQITITATGKGTLKASKTITVKPSEAKPIVFWSFDAQSPTDKKLFKSDWTLLADDSLRANRTVATIRFPDSGDPSQKPGRDLLVIDQLPAENKLDKANIRGVTFDLNTKNLDVTDPDASLQVIMQSPANYWMVVGDVPLKKSDQWQHIEVPLKNEKLLPALPTAYNLRIIVRAKQPVAGSLSVDQIGFMVR